MRDTRQVILDKALALFNERGLPAVSFRALARELDMSPGNLSYHFKKKEEIVEALYLQLVADLATDFPSNAEINLQLVTQNMLSVMRKIFGYRFLMLNFVQVMRQHPGIKSHYRQLQELRRQQFRGIFTALVTQGEMLPEAFPGQFAHLISRMTILGDFWMAEAEILSDLQGEALFQHYYEVLRAEMWPYLSEKGKSLL